MVITIMALLLTLATLSVGRVVAAQQLTSSTMRFVNELSYAAQLAAKENRLVGVRFLKLPDETDPSGAEEYRAWQLLAPDRTTGKWRVLGEPNRLDASTIMIEHDIYSTLLSASPLVGEEAVDDEITTPPIFAFKPEGGTTLSKSSTSPKWCVSLALESDLRQQPNQLPANHRTLVLNPHTGAIVEY
jgi:uncharacterized protein (TIGR02596 family)